TGRAAYVVGGLVLFAGGSAAVYHGIKHVRDRVDTWLNPWAHVHAAGYQSAQGLYSIANGSWWGTGLGRGTLTSTGGTDLIPFVQTDFIYSALAQELGLIGAAALVLVYVVFVLRGMRTAVLADDGFSKL